MTPKWIDKKPEVRRLKKWEAAWLAGCIDSDGSIGLYDYGKEGRRVVVQMANIDHKFLSKIRETVGCGSNVIHIRSSSHIGRKQMYNYCLKGSCRCYWLIKQILPFLIVKKEKANIIIKEIESKPFGRWANCTKAARKKQSKIMKQVWITRRQK